MAARTATLRDVVVLQGPFDQPAAGTALASVVAYFDTGSTSVTSGSDTVDLLTAATAISAFIRDGKTYTPKVMALVQPYRTGATQVAGTVALSSTTLRLTPVSAADFTTAAGTTGTDPIDAPFGVLCTCVVS